MEHILFTKEELLEKLNESKEFNERIKYFDEVEAERIKENMVNEALETMNEISFQGIKNVANLGVEKLRDTGEKILTKASEIEGKVKGKISSIKSSIDDSVSGIKNAYYTGDIQTLENKLLEIVIQSVNKINEKRKKMGQLPISPKSVLTSISNKASKMVK